MLQEVMAYVPGMGVHIVVDLRRMYNRALDLQKDWQQRGGGLPEPEVIRFLDSGNREFTKSGVWSSLINTSFLILMI